MSAGPTGLERLHLVLVHWPVLDRTGETIATATTNLDIHDIARLSTTYGLAGYWIQQPLRSQHGMIERIVSHWVRGPGSRLHPDRPAALGRVRAVRSLEEIADVLGPATWVATTARPERPTVAVSELGRRLVTGESAEPVVLLLGTGWGLVPEVLAAADMVLEPIAISDYNHLSVRSAAAIYVDRLWCAVRRQGPVR